MSEFRCQNSDVRIQMSDVRFQSSVLCPLSSVLCPLSSVLRPLSLNPFTYRKNLCKNLIIIESLEVNCSRTTGGNAKSAPFA